MREIAGVPRVPPGTVPRPRLLAQLDEHRPLTVLRGAGGLGKTTLLAQWVAGRSGHDELVVWLTLDPTTQTRAGFWVRVLGALHRGGLMDDAALYRESAAIADDGGHASAAIQRVLASAGGVLLVLDDFGGPQHFWDEVCHDLIGLLRHETALRCVVSGSGQTLLEGPTAAATVHTKVISDADLSLTRDEAEAVVRASGVAAEVDGVTELLGGESRSVMDLRYGLDLLARTGSTPEAARAAAQRTGSVPAGIRLDLAARLRDPGLLQFVGALALAPFVDERLASELAGAANAGVLLARLVRDGVGHWSRDDDGSAVFRLSDHVRRVAIAQVMTDRPEQVPAILSRIARWLAFDHGDASGAVEYALRAGDLELADRLLVWAYPLSQEDHHHLALLLEAMPGAPFAGHPFLALSYAMYLNAQEGTRERAPEYFAAAAEASRGRTAGASAVDQVIIHGLQTGVYRLLGQKRRMVEAARWTLRRVPGARAEPIDPGHAQAMAAAIGQAATSLLSAEDLAAAAAAFDALSGFAAEHGLGHFGNLAASGRAMIAVLEGRFGAAESALAAVRPGAWPVPWYRGYGGTLRTLAQAWVQINSGEPAAALAELAPLERHETTTEHWDVLGTARAIAKAMTGQAASSALELAQLRRQRQSAATLPAMLVRVALAEAVLQLAAGTPADSSGPVATGASRRALRAISAAARGDTERAVSLLARAEAAARTPIQEALAVVAGAVLAARVSPQLSSVGQARRLAALVKTHTLRWPLLLLVESDREHLVAVLTGAGDRDAHELLAGAFALIPPVVSETLWHGGHAPALTPREREVLLALAETGHRAEIAARLYVSPNTVKAQVRSLYAKLGVRTREEALARAIALGLLQDRFGSAS